MSFSVAVGGICPAALILLRGAPRLFERSTARLGQSLVSPSLPWSVPSHELSGLVVPAARLGPAPPFRVCVE